MSPPDAAKILDLPADATPEQLEARFLELRRKLEDKIAKAPTPGLQAKYRESLAEITTAFETLTLAADSSALPVAQKQSAGGGAISPAASDPSGLRSQVSLPGDGPDKHRDGSSQQRRGLPAAKRKSGSREFALVAIIAVVVLAGGGWFVLKTRAENAEKARLAAEAKLEADRQAEARKKAEEEEKARAAATEKTERERQDRLLVTLRSRLAELNVGFDAALRTEQSAERELSELKAQQRDLARTPQGRSGREARLLATQVRARERHVAWLRDTLPTHPAKIAKARTEELLSARAADDAAIALDDFTLKLGQLNAELAAARQQAETAAVAPTAALPRAGQSWTNSLGQKFVPVPGLSVLFATWETRVQDYAAFAQATGQNWNPAHSGSAHPASQVSWEEARAFCQWLTSQENAEGLLPANAYYRLPTDAEWSVAVDLPAEAGATPLAKSRQLSGYYPWGRQWPPPDGAGNYGQSVGVDSFEGTAPVGSFAPNRFGLFDLGGNLWEWCEDSLDGRGATRTVRGSAYNSGNAAASLLSSSRHGLDGNGAHHSIGFRVVLALPPATAPALAPAAARPDGLQPTLAYLADRLYAYDEPSLRSIRQTILHDHLPTTLFPQLEPYRSNLAKLWTDVEGDIRQHAANEARLRSQVRSQFANAEELLRAIDANQPLAADNLNDATVKALIAVRWQILNIREQVHQARIYFGVPHP